MSPAPPCIQQGLPRALKAGEERGGDTSIRLHALGHEGGQPPERPHLHTILPRVAGPSGTPSPPNHLKQRAEAPLIQTLREPIPTHQKPRK